MGEQQVQSEAGVRGAVGADRADNSVKSVGGTGQPVNAIKGDVWVRCGGKDSVFAHKLDNLFGIVSGIGLKEIKKTMKQFEEVKKNG